MKNIPEILNGRFNIRYRQMGTAEVLLEFKKKKKSKNQLMFHINAVIKSNKCLHRDSC